MSLEESDDQQLMDRISLGDRQAFDVLARRHAGVLLRMTRQWTPSSADAEEAAQQALLNLWQSRGSYRGNGSPRGYLLGIARRAAFRTQRRRVGEPSRHETIEDLGEAAGWGNQSSTTEEQLTARDSLRRALSALSSGDQELLLLRDVSGLSNQEVAETCEISLTQAKGRLHRARLRLLAALEQSDGQ